MFLFGRLMASGRDSVPFSWRVSCLPRHVVSLSLVIKLQRQLLIIGAANNYVTQLQMLFVDITSGKDSLFTFLYNPSCTTPPRRVLLILLSSQGIFPFFFSPPKRKWWPFQEFNFSLVFFACFCSFDLSSNYNIYKVPYSHELEENFWLLRFQFNLLLKYTYSYSDMFSFPQLLLPTFSTSQEDRNHSSYFNKVQVKSYLNRKWGAVRGKMGQADTVSEYQYLQKTATRNKWVKLGWKTLGSWDSELEDKALP